MKNLFEIRGEVAVLFLRRKNGPAIETLVDAMDLPMLQALPYRWHGHWCRHSRCFRVISSAGRSGGKVHLHRVLLDAPDCYQVDHINRDTLDNRRSNLRLATRTLNLLNRRMPRNNTSGTTGIYWHRGAAKWQVRVAGKYYGTFADLEAAKFLAEHHQRIAEADELSKIAQALYPKAA